jgi:carboxyl-terminal processing protease
MRVRTTLLTLLLALTPLLGHGELEKSELDIKRISRSVAYTLPLYHLNQLPLDAHISTNAFNLFINSLDPSHTYFLQTDIDEFRKESEDLYKQLRKGDISFAHNVFNVLLERIENRMTFTEEQLKKGFDTSKDEQFLWDRKDAPWPANEAEWDDLWRKRLKNEYIAQLVSKQLDAEEAAESGTEETGEGPDTNLVAEVEAAGTNLTAQAGEGEDEAFAEENLSPEEFIMERHKQYKLTIESFDEEMLLQRYLTAFAQVYDPHSDYMSPSSVEDFDINMKLSLVGIGAMLRPDDGTARIVRIIPGGPADQDGRLKAGDKIIAVAQGDEEPVSILHWPLYKAVRLIRGEKDTRVTLTIIPASDRSGTRTKKIELVRDEVKLEEQAAKGEVRERELSDEKIRRLGIITLPDFYADFAAASNHEKDARRASVDVRRLLQEQVTQGIDGLVLDLRNNGGGSLVEAIETAGLFISSGPVVQVKENQGVQVLPDADPDMDFDGPMIVLVNRLSASASEILAAALQDYKRAIIVGDEQTHGKGTVQTLMPLGNRKGSLKLTTAGFYRINGGSTQLKGVTPDIIIPSYLDVMGLGEDSLEHALPWDTVYPAMYRTQNGLSELIPLLADQSKERLNNSGEFQVYLAKRERLKERFDTKTISLSLDKRLAEAEAEKELDSIQSIAFMSDEEEEADSTDIILDEALNILSDFIDLKQVVKPEQMLAPNLSARGE